MVVVETGIKGTRGLFSEGSVGFPSSCEVYKLRDNVTLYGISFCIYKESFLSQRFTIVVTQFQVIIATNCPALTRCMNVIYVVCLEQANSLLFRYIVYFVCM
jgi:hypothetical protein